MPASLLAALPWLAPYAAFIRLADRRPDLAAASPARSGPSLSVIIPARNESGTIETVLGSILASTYHPLDVIVVDDCSTDDTAVRVRAIAAHDARVRLLPGEPLPAGWFGKPWACVQGARASTADILVFTDADTVHQPELLAHAAGALAAERAALITVVPRQRCESFWERVVMPQMMVLLGVRFHPRSVNGARHAHQVIANGQFIMVTRAAYAAAVTHEAVKSEVAEDLALAQAVFSHGLRIHFAFAEALMETRMYQSLRHLVEGWSKNVYLGGRRSFPNEPVRRALVPLGLALPSVFWLLPPVVLVVSVLSRGPATAAAGLAVAMSAVFWMIACYGMRVPARYGLAYPLGSLVVLYIALRSTWRGDRRVEWRGRTYSGV